MYLIIRRFRIICTSFSEKGELELLTNATYADYDVFINDIWEPLVAADLRYPVSTFNNLFPSKLVFF